MEAWLRPAASSWQLAERRLRRRAIGAEADKPLQRQRMPRAVRLSSNVRPDGRQKCAERRTRGGIEEGQITLGVGQLAIILQTHESRGGLTRPTDLARGARIPADVCKSGGRVILARPVATVAGVIRLDERSSRGLRRAAGTVLIVICPVSPVTVVPGGMIVGGQSVPPIGP